MSGDEDSGPMLAGSATCAVMAGYALIYLRRRADGRWGWHEYLGDRDTEVSGRTIQDAWRAAAAAWPCAMGAEWDIVRCGAKIAAVRARAGKGAQIHP